MRIPCKDPVIGAEVSAFPNPANSEISLRLGRGVLEEISILDAQGKEISNISNPKQENSVYKFGLADLSKGLYIFQPRIDGVFLRKRMVKE